MFNPVTSKPKDIKALATEVLKELVSTYQQLIVSRIKFVESETMDKITAGLTHEWLTKPKEPEKEKDQEKETGPIKPGSLVDAQWECGGWFPAYLVDHGKDGFGMVLFEDDRKLCNTTFRPRSNEVKQCLLSVYSSKRNFMDYVQYKILETKIMKMQNEVASVLYYMLSASKAGDSVYLESEKVAGCYSQHKIKTTGFVNADVTVLRFWSSEMMATVTSSFAARDALVLPSLSGLVECPDSDYVNAVFFCYRGVTMNTCFVL